MSKYRITLEGRTYEMEIELVPDETVQQSVPRSYKEYRTGESDPIVRVMDPSGQRITTSHSGIVKAPMPGTVILLDKTEGDEVRTGDVVLVLEAMKMENEITAPVDGKIARICCEVGKTVAGGEELFEIV